MSRARYYTPSEVAAHNSSSDCWVSLLGKVYDLTPLCEEHTGSITRSNASVTMIGPCTLLGNILLKPIVTNAGKDISHWFDPKTKDVIIMCTYNCAIDALPHLR